MPRKTVSLPPLILRLLIAAAIAGTLILCSLAIERMKGFFKLSDGAGHTQDRWETGVLSAGPLQAT
jgi:hypothetical protein